MRENLHWNLFAAQVATRDDIAAYDGSRYELENPRIGIVSVSQPVFIPPAPDVAYVGLGYHPRRYDLGSGRRITGLKVNIPAIEERLADVVKEMNAHISRHRHTHGRSGDIRRNELPLHSGDKPCGVGDEAHMGYKAVKLPLHSEKRGNGIGSIRDGDAAPFDIMPRKTGVRRIPEQYELAG